MPETHGKTTDIVGIFASQFTGSYQQVLAALGGGGTVTNSFSATFATLDSPAPVPEPAALLSLLALTGILGLVRLTRGTQS